MFYLPVDTSINVLVVVCVLFDDVNQSAIIMDKTKPKMSKPNKKPWKHVDIDGQQQNGFIDEWYLKTKHYYFDYLTLSL